MHRERMKTKQGLGEARSKEAESLGVSVEGDARAADAGSSANPSNLRHTTDAASKMDYLT